MPTKNYPPATDEGGREFASGAWELRGALAHHTSFSDIMLADEDVVGLKY